MSCDLKEHILGVVTGVWPAPIQRSDPRITRLNPHRLPGPQPHAQVLSAVLITGASYLNSTPTVHFDLEKNCNQDNVPPDSLNLTYSFLMKNELPAAFQ